ncbi:MAG: nicotinate-nucleotide adenylyltransferase [Bacillota bacterium]
MSEKIGILGGSFDPIHIGHIIMAQYAYESLKLDNIYLLPNSNPPHKNKIDLSKANKRLKMCELVSKNNKFIKTLDYEINKEGICYTIDTINYFKKNDFENKEIYFIIGGDSLKNIETWKSYKTLLKKVTFTCIKRIGYLDKEFDEKVNKLKKDFNCNIEIIEMPYLDISSTMIRQRFKNDLSIKYMVDSNVLDYINKYNLYKK